MKRFVFSVSLFLCLIPALVKAGQADTIKWVDFDVSCEAMEYALQQDITSFEEEKHISWIDTLALAACRTGGKCSLSSVKQAAAELKQDKSPEEILNENVRYYAYYHEAYEAALGGLLGKFITFDTTGLDFALTALFVVLFMEQWKKKENRFAGVVGIACAAASLAIFGADRMVIAAMALILLVLLGGRKRVCT